MAPNRIRRRPHRTRQQARITGQVENCQTVVFAAYVTARAHVLSEIRLYLPKA